MLHLQGLRETAASVVPANSLEFSACWFMLSIKA
jgi:hypothetical protein